MCDTHFLNIGGVDSLPNVARAGAANLLFLLVPAAGVEPATY